MIKVKFLMKILKLVIKDPDEKILRDVDFKENGISFIYGDIKEPDNKTSTINSLGKTLLLKFIDYILGAKVDQKIVKKDVYSYIIRS